MIHPPIATREEWLAARRELLVREKEATRQRDAVSAMRRRLPMVPIEKDYVFTGPKGEARLVDLFDGRHQLIVYHFMFDPAWEDGCPGCTGFVNGQGDKSGLAERDTTFALVSRAPFAKLEAYKTRRGWTLPWYSSYGSDFNYDFHATYDRSVAPIQVNFKDEVDLGIADPAALPHGESHGLSVFFRVDDQVYHTYSTYIRGVEGLSDWFYLLDVTPWGRQEDWEDSPSGWPQRPTYG
jgi:predicted dithiol-disulfide oxidoreductase (DUF899 family)